MIDKKNLVSRKAVLAIMRRWGLVGMDKKDAENLLGALEEMPAVDPVKHGVWKPGDGKCPVCGENKYKDLDADIWSDWQPPFCPNCGAEMKKGEVK